jgi:hypothetical protein
MADTSIEWLTFSLKEMENHIIGHSAQVAALNKDQDIFPQQQQQFNVEMSEIIMKVLNSTGTPCHNRFSTSSAHFYADIANYLCSRFSSQLKQPWNDRDWTYGTLSP